MDDQAVVLSSSQKLETPKVLKKTKVKVVTNKESFQRLSVRSLINYISNLISLKSKLLKVVDHPDILIKGLEELDSLIEMEDVKFAVIQQTQYLLILAYSQLNLLGNAKRVRRYPSDKLHLVLYGSPGVGKSRMAKCIALIWYGLGVLCHVEGDKESVLTELPTLYPLKPVDAFEPPKHVSDTLMKVATEAVDITGKINQIRESLLDLRKTYVPDYNSGQVSVPKVKGTSKEACGGEEVEVETRGFKRDPTDPWLRAQNDWNCLLELIRECSGMSIKLLTSCQPIINEPNDDYEEESPKPITNGESLAKSPNEEKKGKQISPLSRANIRIVDLPSLLPLSKSSKPKEFSNDMAYVVCGREDLVAEYAGQTAPKTKEFLMKNRGKVIIIEEAYLLWTGDRDSFGMEALTVLNRFMDEHPGEIVIIMTGYKKLMAETIFQAQPGLRRRCQWVFEVSDYTSKGLSDIFLQQLTMIDKDCNIKWKMNPEVDIVSFFDKNKKLFGAYGGDTERLALHVRMVYCQSKFTSLMDSVLSPEQPEIDLDFAITKEILEQAFTDFKSNKVIEIAELSPPPIHMYH